MGKQLVLQKQISENYISTKQVKIGFSWTIFFFGFIAFAIRGQYKEALIQLALWFIFLGFFIGIYYSFVGNKNLLIKLFEEGYALNTELTGEIALVEGRMKGYIN